MQTLYCVDTVERLIKALETIQSDVNKRAENKIEIKLMTIFEEPIIEVEYDAESNTVILR